MSTPKNILLVYEEIPERTVIALIDGADLAAAGLSASEIASLHAKYVNSTDMSEDEHKLHNKVAEAIFGEYVSADGDESGYHKPALWGSKVIFATDDESLCREGMPPEIDGNTIVVHTGFVL